jgi:16S rRNA (guanine527-N7)-methyltransferase
LRQNGVELTSLQRAQLDQYVSLLTDWNRRINLVSRRDEANIWMSHIFHSLTPLVLLELPENIRGLDLGTGGGLPGIPLAVVQKGLAITLLDSIRKKSVALQEIVAELGLPEANIALGRAEEMGRDPRHAGGYDMVVARAVAPLPDLVKWARPFLAEPSGKVARRRGKFGSGKSEFRFPYLLALKGGDLGSEIRGVLLSDPALTITELGLVFPGSEQLELADKKIVIVEYV